MDDGTRPIYPLRPESLALLVQFRQLTSFLYSESNLSPHSVFYTTYRICWIRNPNPAEATRQIPVASHCQCPIHTHPFLTGRLVIFPYRRIISGLSYGLGHTFLLSSCTRTRYYYSLESLTLASKDPPVLPLARRQNCLLVQRGGSFVEFNFFFFLGRDSLPFRSFHLPQSFPV